MEAGHDHPSPLNSHPNIHTRYKECIAVLAKQSAVPPLNSYPLAHGNFSCEFDTPVAPRRVDRKEEPGLLEEDCYPFPCYPPAVRVC
jgi:hypothetical protein